MLRILGEIVHSVMKSEPSAERQKPNADNSPSTDLYTCSDCKLTYIKNDMSVCPECGEMVDRTPSFSELGIKPKGNS